MSKTETLITQLKNYISVRPYYFYRKHTYISSMYNATQKEYSNTNFSKVVSNLYFYNLNRGIYFGINNKYINELYNLFLKTKAKIEEINMVIEPKKAAILIGINYKESEYQLDGCENDIINLKKILISKYDYKEEDIIMLSESFSIKPTRDNILEQMQNIVDKSNNGYTSVCFHYSGHGTYITDLNNDELDNYDECIVTSDMDLITDDEFKSKFISRINKNTKMFVLMDCCHSGTIMDLNYKYISEVSLWVTENKNTTNNPNIIALSGCKDEQTSNDAWFGDNWQGALTKCFIDTIVDTNYNPKLFELLKKLREYIKIREFTQIPQLTSNKNINKNDRFSL